MCGQWKKLVEPGSADVK